MNMKEQIQLLADRYAAELNKRITERITVMERDDNSHYLIYRVLGISKDEGNAIDLYQNKGRFLYNYAGAFLENAARICFGSKYPDAEFSVRIPNTHGQRPKTFEIDCLIGDSAYEVKWRDATTDGDHITKEHTRLLATIDAGFTPFRIMFYYPNRLQAIRIQKTLETLYHGLNGKYFYGDNAWTHIFEKTEVNLKQILEEIASEREV